LKNCDEKNNRIKKSEPNYIQKNLILDKYSTKVQEIIFNYTIEEKNLTFTLFEQELNQTHNRKKSFYDFADEIIKLKYTRKNTIGSHIKHVNKLKQFRPELTFDEINYDFIMNYKMYLEKEIGNATATISKALAIIKMFLNEALNRGIIKETPFKSIKIATMKGKHQILEIYELKKLSNYYEVNKNKLSKGRVETLRAFLFSCFCGLRYGDVRNLKYKNINIDGVLSIIEEKTGKETTIPLSEYAKSLISEKFISENQNVFSLSANQVVNRFLKEIAQDINSGISKNVKPISEKLTFHYSRRTFATYFYNANGDLLLTSSMTGHESVDTTAKHYAQPLLERQRQGLENFEKYIFENN
ncbi:MAG: site-specific integrase, partial [Bacteroidales bacterium]|nr:site-specific integrase [Bacteroidales bacterium]